MYLFLISTQSLPAFLILKKNKHQLSLFTTCPFFPQPGTQPLTRNVNIYDLHKAHAHAHAHAQCLLHTQAHMLVTC